MEIDPTPRVISRGSYYKLCGLMALADRHNRALADIEKAAIEITGEDGHTSDEIYSRSCSADGLLAGLGIEVEEATDAN